MSPKRSGAGSKLKKDPLAAARDAAEAFGAGDLDKAERLLEGGILAAADRAADPSAGPAAENEGSISAADAGSGDWSQNGGLPALLVFRAQAALERGSFRHAVVLCTAALRLAPTYTAALNSRGVALACMGEPAAAIRDLDAAIESCPSAEAAMPVANRGRVRLMLGDVDGSRADISEALRQAEEAQERRKKLRRAAKRAGTKSTAAVRFSAGARGKGRGKAGGAESAGASKDEVEEGMEKERGGAEESPSSEAQGGGGSRTPSAMLRYPGPERQVLQEQETMGLALSTTGGMAHFAAVAALGGDAARAKEAFTQAGKSQPSMPLWLAWAKAQMDIHAGGDAARALERPVTRARRPLAQADGCSLRDQPPRGGTCSPVPTNSSLPLTLDALATAATGAVLAAALCARAAASLARGGVHGAATDAKEAALVAPRESPLRAKAWALQGAATEACAMLWARGDRVALRQSRRALEEEAEAFVAAHATHRSAVADAERVLAEARQAEKRPAQAAQGEEEGGGGADEEDKADKADSKKAAKKARRKAETALRKLGAKAPMFHLLEGEESSGESASEGLEQGDQAASLGARALPERMALCDDDLASSGAGGAVEREPSAAAADVAHARALCAAALPCYETAASASRTPFVSALLGEARVLQQLGSLDEAVSRWQAAALAASAHVTAPSEGEGRPTDALLAAVVPEAVLSLPGAGGAGDRDRLRGGLQEALAAWEAPKAGRAVGDLPATSGKESHEHGAFYDGAYDAAYAQAHGLGAQLTQWRAPLAALSAEIEEAVGSGGGEHAEPVVSARLIECLQDRARIYATFGAVLPALEDSERARFLLSRVRREEDRSGHALRVALYQALHRSDGPTVPIEGVTGGLA